MVGLLRRPEGLRVLVNRVVRTRTAARVDGGLGRLLTQRVETGTRRLVRVAVVVVVILLGLRVCAVVVRRARAAPTAAGARGPDTAAAAGRRRRGRQARGI